MREIIDAHMHMSQWLLPDGQTAFELLEQYQASNNLKHVDDMACTNNGKLWPGYEPDQSLLAAVTKLRLPTTYIHGCLYIPEEGPVPEALSFPHQLEEMMEVGFDGIKIIEFKPDAYRLYQLDKRMEEYEEYLDLCEKYDIPMCWHIADPECFWHNGRYNDPSFPTYEKLSAWTYGALDRHPNLRVMLAHLFFKCFRPEETVALLEKYPNVTLDIVPEWEMYDAFRNNYDWWSAFFRRYSHRILYGTDSNMRLGFERVDRQAKHVYRFLTTDECYDWPEKCSARGIKLEDEHLDNILWRNFRRNMGDKPKELNRPALKKYIAKYLPFMPDTKNRQMLEEYYRKNLL